MAALPPMRQCSVIYADQENSVPFHRRFRYNSNLECSKIGTTSNINLLIGNFLFGVCILTECTIRLVNGSDSNKHAVLCKS